MPTPKVGIIGGGPAGLMAAEAACASGAQVTVFDSMPSVGRKLLMAGKSGLNITHAEPLPAFLSRYGAARDRLEPALTAFGAQHLRDWCAALGVETFVGSSGRVFPTAMKASPLLRAWLRRLSAAGVRFRPRHRWMGWEREEIAFETADGRSVERVDAVVLALGGASWPRLGSDAAWVPLLAERKIPISPLKPANCGFEVGWTDLFAERFAGTPVKAVTARSDAGAVPGEFVVTRWGVEGSLIYGHAAALREMLGATDQATLLLDLAPGRSIDRIRRDLQRQPDKASFSNRMRKGLGLDPVKLGLLREIVPGVATLSAEALAARIKELPLRVVRPRPIEQAISTAGGIAWESIETDFMLTGLPGVFAAGEMLDWEAPTGGYLLTACWATGRAAGRAAADYAAKRVGRG